MSKAILAALGLSAALMTSAWAQAPAAPATRSAPAAVASKPAAAPAARKAAFDASGCFGCHTQIQGFHDSGKHKGLACTSCHTGIENHVADVSKRPLTKTDPATCGACHEAQYRTSVEMDWHRPARFEKKQLTGPSPNNNFDRFLYPHAFTREHNLPRSHSFALVDQMLVDRAFGGRFEPRNGWQYLTGSGDQSLWSVIVDKYPDNTEQKPFRPGTAAAANPVCLSCKTQDHILDWAYMGDPVPGAKWSRTSKVVELVKDVKHPMNCIFCHDPHAAKPRIVRDALIQAVTRTDFPTLYSQDPRRAKVSVQDVGVRGFPRKIAMLDRYSSKLQCAQCHVEYNCNPGIDPKTGQPITMADPRTNVFPFVAIDQVSKFYDHISFRDFRNAQSGALLTKVQHPDSEIYYNSKHDKAGVECNSCHMPKVKDAKTGKTYTSHWQTNPRHYIKETCLTCHHQWNETQVKYTMDSMQGRYQGKVRHAEFWLNQLLDAFLDAQAAGVDATALNAARAKHDEAHVNWEWWTASNGSAFHNLEQAESSLAKSVTASQEGIKILRDAIIAKKGATAAAAVPPSTLPAVPQGGKL